ncbi:GTPase HflX [bacterium]|nr:GTPase HflX [bacterium]
MIEIEHKKPGDREKAVLVSVIRAGTAAWVAEDHLDELSALADTAGADEVARVMQPRMKPDPATFIGTGKVSEVTQIAAQHEAGLVIFDDDLTPVQMRNLEQKLKRKVVDRSGLILDIFASRARTREAKVQVELAQLEYYYPRLTKMWSHLKGSQGGIGFRGPGETQLEVDRRAVQRRISALKKDLGKIAKQRATRRKGRRSTPTVALVGYTNVGKSTLLNALSGSDDAFVENRLFATLDSKVRRVEQNRGKPILVIDTVGFIRKLPHHLVASFRSTLEEAQDADVLVHVADISHPHVETQMEQTLKVLAELGLKEKTTLTIFNKTDRVPSPGVLDKMKETYPHALFLSATTGLRLWQLVERLEAMLYVGYMEVDLEVTPDQLSKLESAEGDVQLQNKEWTEGSIRLTLTGSKSDVQRALNRAGLHPDSGERKR